MKPCVPPLPRNPIVISREDRRAAFGTLLFIVALAAIGMGMLP